MIPRVVLGFDMETDIGSWTPFYEGLVHGTPRILEVLSKHDVEATFVFTGDSAALHPEVVRLVDDAGHEVGCHSLYHETLGEELFQIPGIKPVLPEECYGRIRLATDMVEQAVGRKVVTFRCPRLWGSTAVVNALEDLGYKADLSYPMFFYKERLVPYHPSREDWTREGDMRILQVPNFADMTIESKDPYGRDRDQWPLFRTEGARALISHVDSMIDFYRERDLPPVICFYMHPWEFHDMPQGLIHYGEGAVLPDPFITKNCGEVAVAELDRLLALFKERQARFLTAAELTEESR